MQPKYKKSSCKFQSINYFKKNYKFIFLIGKNDYNDKYHIKNIESIL